MANRYWVGGTGDWSEQNHWSDTSGGIVGVILTLEINNGGSGYVESDILDISGGGDGNANFEVLSVDGNGAITSISLLAGGKYYPVSNDILCSGGTGAGATVNILTTTEGPGVPTSSDDVFIDNNSAPSGPTWWSIASWADGYCKNFNDICDNSNFQFDSNAITYVYGSLLLGANHIYTNTPAHFTLMSDSNETITSNGCTISELALYGTGSVSLNDDIVTLSYIDVSNGTFYTNDKAVTCATFSPSISATLYMGNSIFNVLNFNINGATAIYPGGSLIQVRDTVNADVQGSDNTNNCPLNNIEFLGQTCGVGGVLIFNNLKVPPGSTVTTNAANLQFNSLSCSGTAGNIVTINGNEGYMYCYSGVISLDYVDISDCNAGGGARFYAGTHSVDGTGNTGWIFTAPPKTPLPAFYRY
jgi:hypothetical protein